MSLSLRLPDSRLLVTSPCISSAFLDQTRIKLSFNTSILCKSSADFKLNILRDSIATPSNSMDPHDLSTAVGGLSITKNKKKKRAPRRKKVRTFESQRRRSYANHSGSAPSRSATRPSTLQSCSRAYSFTSRYETSCSRKQSAQPGRTASKPRRVCNKVCSFSFQRAIQRPTLLRSCFQLLGRCSKTMATRRTFATP